MRLNDYLMNSRRLTLLAVIIMLFGMLNANVDAAKKVHASENKGLSFDGKNDGVALQKGVDLKAFPQFTICAWVLLDTTDNASPIFTAREEGSWSPVWLKYSNKSFRLRVGTGKSNDVVDSKISPVPGKWYHITGIVQTGKSISLYVNGKLEGSKKFKTLGRPSSVYQFIGKKEARGEEYLDGSIDDVLIYKRALSADEIKGLYAEKSPDSKGLVACWSLGFRSAGNLTVLRRTGGWYYRSAVRGNGRRNSQILSSRREVFSQ